MTDEECEEGLTDMLVFYLQGQRLRRVGQRALRTFGRSEEGAEHT